MIFGQKPFNISSSSTQSGTPEINNSGNCSPLTIPRVVSAEVLSTEDGFDFDFEPSNETSLGDATETNLFDRYCPGFVSEDTEPDAPVARPVILLEGGGRIYDLCDEDTESAAGSSASADEHELDDFDDRENTETPGASTCDQPVCTDGSTNAIKDDLLDLSDFGTSGRPQSVDATKNEESTCPDESRAATDNLLDFSGFGIAG